MMVLKVVGIAQILRWKLFSLLPSKRIYLLSITGTLPGILIREEVRCRKRMGQVNGRIEEWVSKEGTNRWVETRTFPLQRWSKFMWLNRPIMGRQHRHDDRKIKLLGLDREAYLFTKCKILVVSLGLVSGFGTLYMSAGFFWLKFAQVVLVSSSFGIGFGVSM